MFLYVYIGLLLSLKFALLFFFLFFVAYLFSSSEKRRLQGMDAIAPRIAFCMFFRKEKSTHNARQES
jgi:hypothetical protein